MSGPYAAGVTAVVAVVLLVGCGSHDRTIDAAKLEREIESSLSSATAQVAAVDCPNDVKSETGAKLTCHAKLKGGGSADVTVTETHAPNQFTYSFKPGTVVLSGASLDKELEKTAAANGIPNATVNCPELVKVEPGKTVACPASGVHGTATVSFEFSDSTGSIQSSSVQTGS